MTFPQFAALSHLTRTRTSLKNVPLRVGQVLARWRDALHIWVSPRQNPFWALAHRIEARQGHPARLWMWASLAWAFFAFCTLYFWDSPQAEQGQLPLSQGRDAFGFLALLWFSIFLGAAFVGARVRSNTVLRAMLLKGQLLPLQYTPLADEDRAWHLTAPSALVGLFAALGALPALCFGIGHSDWTPRDLLGLVALVAVGVWNVPKWSPGTWQAQIEKTATAPKGDGFWKPGQLGIAWTGWRSLFISGVLALACAPTLLLSAVASLVSGIAPEVLQLSEAFWLNWPLSISRFLVTPLPFFGFALPPIILLLPLWMATQDRKLLRLTAVLGADRLFWTNARQERWQRDERAIVALWVVLGLGLAWPDFIGKGSLSQFWQWNTSPASLGTEGALAAWFYLCVLGTATAATALWRETMERPGIPNGAGALTPRARWPLAGARAQRALFAGTLVWLGGCVLGWQTPLSIATLPYALVALILGALWMLAQTAVALGNVTEANPQWKEFLPRTLHPTSVHLAWFYSGLFFINIPAWWFLDGYYWRPWMLALSPLSLWLAPRLAGTLSAPWFWSAIAAHAMVGAWWLWRVWQCLPVPTSETAQDSAETTPSQPRQERLWTALDWKPTPAKAPTGTVRPTRLSRAPLRTPSMLQRHLLSRLDRFENPLLILETRRLMGDVDWIYGWKVGSGWLAFGLCVMVALIGNSQTHYPLSSAAYVSFTLLCGFALIALIGYGTHANDSYDRDRLEGTLESLFLSPLSEAAIAQSKIVPHLVALWPPTLILQVFLLVLALLATLEGELLLWPLAFVTIAALLAFVARNLTLSHLLALTSKKTGAGGIRMGLVATPLIIAELWAVFITLTYGGGAFCLAILCYTVLLGVEALVLWQVSLARLRALRRTR